MSFLNFVTGGPNHLGLRYLLPQNLFFGSSRSDDSKDTSQNAYFTSISPF